MAKRLIPGSDAILVEADGNVVVKTTNNQSTIGSVGMFQGLTKITVSDSAPQNPSVGDLWLDTS